MVDYYGQPTSYFLWPVCPPYRPKCPKMGFEPGFEPIFFATWRGPTRERVVRSTPPPRSGAEGKFFTPKAYLHTSFCVQKMGDPELSFRLHRVLFCVEHNGTLPHSRLTHRPAPTKNDLFEWISAPSCIPPPYTPSPPRAHVHIARAHRTCTCTSHVHIAAHLHMARAHGTYTC